ncbi:uncharacterized protein PFL1_04424 [Pseudozyma flocculosa PF-1]|uniref:Uncharacterized protein n=2 Tax=Pseudozyma flocculosa TaxID=84751 RepID=A0A5C3FDY2_9BASI|nr:uncharacterized protein PFL1_04424 [Pseudozyma flocculosa PF-1]EPQ28097.1 hypothetical protein PFL1_04424 [Pseudozyma flocculosa PF-1]SPO41895.1 uncharacterized protein PSFLO_07377 [Pseudozyma flocculosa]
MARQDPLPASSKFSFRSAFTSASKAHKPATAAHSTAHRHGSPASKMVAATPASPPEPLSKQSKLPTSTASLRHKASSVSQLQPATTLGKRTGHATDLDAGTATPSSSTPTAAQQATIGANSTNQAPSVAQFGTGTRTKLSSLRSKLPGPPPARFGTFSASSTKPNPTTAASPSTKLSKIARSNSLRDVHGAAAAHAAATRQQAQTSTRATAGSLTTSSSNSSLRGGANTRSATIPKSRSRTGSTLVLHNNGAETSSKAADAADTGVVAGADGLGRKRAQSAYGGAPSSGSPRKAAAALPTPGPTPDQAATASPDARDGRSAGALTQVGNLAATAGASRLGRVPSQRRPSSVDLGKPPSTHSRRASIDQTVLQSSGIQGAPQSTDKENLASAGRAKAGVGPPPTPLGLAQRSIAKGPSSLALRGKRSSLPVATTLLGAVQTKEHDVQQPTSIATAGVNADPPTATYMTREPPARALDGSGTSRSSTIDKADLGIANSVLKAHPITHPTVLAMRHKASYQPIDTPQALIKGKKRLSGVLVHPLDLGSASRSAGKSGWAEATAPVKPFTALPVKSGLPPRITAPGVTATATPPTSPTKSHARSGLTFPTRSSPPTDALAMAKQQQQQLARSSGKPNGRALSSAEIDADLLASLQAVARKANLNMREVETMLAADKLQREQPGPASTMPDTRDSPARSSDADVDQGRLRGAHTPSLSQMSLSAIGRSGRLRYGRHGPAKASEEDATLENIGDQSLDFRAIGSSPLGGESPLLRSSDALSPERGNDADDVLQDELALGSTSPSLNRARQADTGTDTRNLPERNSARDASRQALRESIGLETMLGLRTSDSQHESLLGMELVSASHSNNGLSKRGSSLMLMDESFVEELAETAEDLGLDQSVVSASHALLRGDQAATLAIGGEAEVETGQPVHEVDGASARMREVEDRHARQVAALEAQLAELTSQLALAESAAVATAMVTATAEERYHDDDAGRTEAEQLRQDLDSALASVSGREQACRRLEEANGLLDAQVRNAGCDEARRQWGAIKKLGLVELQDIRGQQDACIFWSAQLDLWQAMVVRAAQRDALGLALGP